MRALELSATDGVGDVTLLSCIQRVELQLFNHLDGLPKLAIRQNSQGHRNTGGLLKKRL
jgi:hypothetical protein